MKLVNVVKLRSHDAETQVGAVLVREDTGAVVATGFNGFVRGAADDKLPNTRPEKYPFMVHAEENVITHCARHGISTAGCIIYQNTSPCVHCARLLWQCGIDTVVVEQVVATPSLQRYFDELQKMQDLRVMMLGTQEHYVSLTLAPRIE